MVNLVLITKGRPMLLRQAIDSLRSHTDAGAYNLTLVNDGGLTGFRALDNEVFVSISRSRGIVGLVRNIGADFAQRYWGRGDWLYFSDNDVSFHPGWLEKLEAVAIDHHEFKVIGGCRHPFHQPHSTASTAMGWADRSAVDLAIESTDAVAGYSMLMSWDTWDDHGPFDQHAKGVGQSEDFAVCQKVVAAGYKVGYVSPPVLTVTGLTNTLGEKVPGYEALKAMVPTGVIAE